MEACFALFGADLASKDQVHQRTLNEDVTEESSDEAEGEVEGEQVEHGQVGEEERLVHGGDERRIDDREDQVDKIAQLR